MIDCKMIHEKQKWLSNIETDRKIDFPLENYHYFAWPKIDAREEAHRGVRIMPLLCCKAA